MGVAAISDDSFEFEAKSKTDGSWHPCRASLSSSTGKFEIALDFGNDEEDVISSTEDALERLRLRSIPLQNGQCSHIKEGDLILCMNKNQFKNLYFDAVVEKINKVKHSNRIYCRCTFEIKWVVPKMDAESDTVPSTSVMKLSGDHISSHKSFAAFFNSFEPSNSIEEPSFLGSLEETTFESDLQEILKRQVEDITKLAGGSDNLGDLLLEVKKVPSNNKSEFRRTTRSQRKEQPVIDPKKDLEKQPLNPRPLNPLAACAALASALHEQLSYEPAISSFQLGEEHQHNLPSEGVKKHDDKKIIESHSTRNLRRRGNALPNLTQGAKDIASSSFTSSAASISARDIGKSLYEGSESTTSFQDDSVTSATAIVKQSAKLGKPEMSRSASVTGRQTRSAAKNQMLNSVSEVQKESLTKTLRSSKNKNVAPSRHQKVDEDMQESEKISWGEETRLLDSAGNQSWLKEMGDVDTPVKNESKKRTPISSSADTKTGISYASSKHDEGMILHDGESLPAKKTRASFAKPVLRSSPRLRSLPRTMP